MNLMDYHEQNEREANPSILPAPGSALGNLPLSSSSAPGSPKIHELRARYEAQHDNDLKSSNPDQVI